MRGHSADEKNILSQALVALGQGTGPIRVSRAACQAFVDHYEPWIQRKRLASSWSDDGVQVLERVRAIGRLAALRATSEARTAIGPEDVETAMSAVEALATTALCDD